MKILLCKNGKFLSQFKKLESELANFTAQFVKKNLRIQKKCSVDVVAFKILPELTDSNHKNMEGVRLYDEN